PAYSLAGSGFPDGFGPKGFCAAFRRLRFARRASARRACRAAAADPGLAAFSGGFCGIPAPGPTPLPIAEAFRYAGPLLNYAKCCRSSVVERILGKAEVGSSILPGSTSLREPGFVEALTG